VASEKRQPGLFQLMREDAQAALARDPGAASMLEIVLFSTGTHIVWAHRRHHWLYQHGFKALARWLAKRMRVSREIGQYKKEHGMTVMQTTRYAEILDKRGAQGSLCGMDSTFMKHIFEAIHEESVRQQVEEINK
jgi:chorismate mutase